MQGKGELYEHNNVRCLTRARECEPFFIVPCFMWTINLLMRAGRAELKTRRIMLCNQISNIFS